MATTENAYFQEVQCIQKNRYCAIDVLLICWDLVESPRDFVAQKCDPNWLKEALPRSHPQARFLVFDYQGHVAQGSKDENTGPATISNAARKLLSECERLKPNVFSHLSKDWPGRATNSRPLIFVCRGLGGLVVKEALLMAATQNEIDSIVRRIGGIVFLGTPHAGDAEDWEKIFQTDPETVGGCSVNEVFSQRPDFCEAFSRISSTFRDLLPSYKTVSFCQEGWSECSNASILHEGCFWPMTPYPTIPNSKREHYIVPRSFPVSAMKARVKATIDCMITGTLRRHNSLCKSVETQRAVLRKLAEDRLFNTCTWILKTDQYKEWLQADSVTCLWICGLPGTGKSIISSAIVDNLKGLRRSKTVIITCFMDEAMGFKDYARSVLHTIISQLEVHQQISFCTQSAQSILMDLETSTFQITPAVFRYHLQHIFADIETEDRIIFVVDGIDTDEWINALIIREIVQANASRCQQHVGLFKCSISSRTSKDSSAPQNQVADIELSKEPGLQRDLKAFAEDRLSSLTQRSCKEGSSPAIVRRLCSLAETNFLWISLVFGNLIGLHSHPCSFNDFLESLPRGLDGLYSMILQRVQSEDFLTANKIFSWILAARRPLSWSELIEAVNVGDSSPTSKRLLRSRQDLLTTCGSLVTVTKDNMVRLVHSSVRDFLLSDHREARTWNSIQQAQVLLATACLTVLSSSQVEIDSLLNSYSHEEQGYFCFNGPPSTLVEYATVNWKLHYGLAESASQLLPGNLQRFLNVSLNHAYQYRSIETQGRSTRIAQTILRLCSRYGFRKMVQMCLEMGVPPDCDSCNYCDQPIHLAAIEGHTEIVALLLKKAAGVDTRTFAESRTPLHSAVIGRSLETVRLLLQHGARADAVTSDTALTPLHIATTMGDLKAVQLLINFGADVNAKLEITEETPLHLAVAHGHISVVKCLVDWCDGSAKALDLYENIVQQSYYQSWSDGILSDRCKSSQFVWEYDARSLAERDMQHFLLWARTCADISVRDIKGRTPLHLAAYHGHEAIVRLLLESGASQEAQDNEGLTALQLAVTCGHALIVRVLMMAGVNLNLDMKSWSAALEQAADKGHAPVANLVIWQTFNAELNGPPNLWPLIHLAMRGKHNVIQSALSRKRAQSSKSKAGAAARLAIRHRDI